VALRDRRSAQEDPVNQTDPTGHCYTANGDVTKTGPLVPCGGQAEYNRERSALVAHARAEDRVQQCPAPHISVESL
jgi:hypothetical protein